MSTATARGYLITSCTLLVGASFGCADERRPVFHVQPDPELGATSFVSAAGPSGSYNGPTAAPTDDRDTDAGGEVSIEEGDIYRPLGAGKILNLNAYRGLQVIDVANPEAPAVIGSLRMSGSPVELYVAGDHALVLMNDWYGYWGSRGASTYGKEQGGAVLLVDLSDPTAPVVLDRAVVPGYIQRSRLAKGTRTNLYVAASLWQLYDDGGTTVAVGSGDRTVVKSLELVGKTLVERKEVDLGGWISDIAATPRALLVARTNWTDSGAHSQVAVVDISAEDGVLAMGPDITVAGQVKSQFNLDLRGDILRVVSEGGWSSDTDARTNHLETFDLADLAHPQPVDHKTFGAGESLYATLFVGADKAFFVTYLRQDPFHAFSIDAQGHATERSQFIVSGWNDFFRATFADTRLVGVGIDDADGARKLAVSLYDITDLTAAEPLVSRASVTLDSAWSEASWDHRAFTVLEDAVSIPAAGAGIPATLETGLVLLPYSGWNADGYVSGVQLFTFSPTTLSARGTLDHPMAVRRAFLVAEDTAACLSDVTLSTHDVSDPDDPTTLGTVDLAPSYPSLDIYGDYGLRAVDTGARDYWGTNHEPPRGRADVIPLTGDPDRAAAITSFELAPGAALTQVGELAVAMSAAWQADPADASKYAWETTVEVWDLTTPTAPVRRGELVTSALPVAFGGWYAQGDTPRPAAMPDCMDCGITRAAPSGTVVGDAMVFVEGISESAAAGTQVLCVTVPPGESGGVVDPSEPPETRLAGRRARRGRERRHLLQRPHRVRARRHRPRVLLRRHLRVQRPRGRVHGRGRPGVDRRRDDLQGGVGQSLLDTLRAARARPVRSGAADRARSDRSARRRGGRGPIGRRRDPVGIVARAVRRRR